MSPSNNINKAVMNRLDEFTKSLNSNDNFMGGTVPFCGSCGSRLQISDEKCENCGDPLAVENILVGQFSIKHADVFTKMDNPS